RRPEEPYTNSVRTVLWEPGRVTVPATRDGRAQRSYPNHTPAYSPMHWVRKSGRSIKGSDTPHRAQRGKGSEATLTAPPPALPPCKSRRGRPSPRPTANHFFRSFVPLSHRYP